MALLKVAGQGERTFRSVRMAPLYDSVTTRVFPRLKHDRMAIKVNGRDDRLRREDFRAWAMTVGLRASDADKAIDDLLGRMEKAAGRVQLPEILKYGSGSRKAVKEMLEIIRSRLGTLG
jgi:serine/threonine-protein kinase HipA